MTSPQDPDVQSRIRRGFSTDVSSNDDMSDAWTLWAEKELGETPAPTTATTAPPTGNPVTAGKPLSTSGTQQLPQRESRAVDDNLVRARTATSEDLLEERVATTAPIAGAGAAAMGTVGALAAPDVATDVQIPDVEIPDVKPESVVSEVKAAEPPTIKVAEIDKPVFADAPSIAAQAAAGTDERPVADRGMVGEQSGQARFERVDSVDGDDESSSPRLGWLILGALIAAGLVAALMWLWKRPPSVDSVTDPISQSTTTSVFGSTPGVTSPTATTAPGLTGTTAVGGLGATGAGMLSLNTTSVAFGMGETSKGIVVRNMGTAPATWSASGPVNAVTITPASGTLAPGAIAVIQISRGMTATPGATAQVQISTGTGAPQIVTVTF